MAELIKELKLQNFTPFEILEKKKRNQKKININGIDIYFPYDVYPNQIKYMEKIIELLNNNINREDNTNIAALESPTGTGKTLCLLCSTLAWMNEMRKQKKFGGKIIYTTRTHSQISQIIHELQKTCYWPRTAILSSRDISCVNSKIRNNCNGAILNIRCRKNNVNCPYYNGVLQDKREKNNCLDIESLCINGKKQTFCPFYQQIESAKSYSDIAFMPYNYIFDEDINDIMGIDIKNNIIIIDEAHNIRQVCEDSKSVEINDNDFDDIISDISQLLDYEEKNENSVGLLDKKEKKKSPSLEISKNDLNIEINIIKSIKNAFNSPKIEIEDEGKKLNYLEFFEIFIDNDIKKNKKRKKKVAYKNDSFDSKTNIPENVNISNIEIHIKFLKNVNNTYQNVFEKGSKISILIKIFNIINQLSENIDLQSSYVFYIENKEIKNKESNNFNEIKKIRIFNIYCFNPQLEFSDILEKKPYSIIFTSGTLTPFKIFEDEFKIKFEITLENRHIVPIEQFIFEIITNYSEDNTYRFDYKNRNNLEMVKALGNEICNYCQKTPYGGILVFFPSYFYLNKCESLWNDSGINNKIRQYKKIYVDSAKDKSLLNEIKKNSNKNYIIFSVYRGSSSEGIDFSDDCARMVICVGIPFANLIDKRIKLKIEYLNISNSNNKNLVEGSEWYLVNAMTAVNQSLGRVIRHINDYGVLICIDERFHFYEKYFSFWIREHYEEYKYNDMDIIDFFNEQRKKFQNIKVNNNIKPNNINSNQSGFVSTITFDKNFFNNKKEYENYEKYQNDNNINFLGEIELISSDEDNDKSIFEILNKKTTQNNQVLVHIFEFDIPNVNQKDNNSEELDIIFDNKDNSNNNKILEDKKIYEDEKDNVVNNNYEKEGLELLESLNEFLINNPKDFDKILNKFK